MNFGYPRNAGDIPMGSLKTWMGILIGSLFVFPLISGDGDENTQNKIVASSPALKFMELLRFQEMDQEAQFIVQTEDGGGTTFLNARSLDVIHLNSGGSDISGEKSEVKLKVTVGCRMIYTLYPFDSHLCSMTLTLPKDVSFMTPKFCGDLRAYEFHVKGYLALPLITPANMSSPENDGSSGHKRSHQLIYFIMERTSTQQIFSEMYSPLMMLALLSFLTLLDSLPLQIRVASSLSMLLTSLVVTSILWRKIPRSATGDPTVLEHFFAICVGFIFQVFLNNILLLWYSKLAAKKIALKNSPRDIESNKVIGNGNNDNLSISTTTTVEMHDAKKSASKKPDGLTEAEEIIIGLGKFHRMMYMKSLKAAKKQLPIVFLVIIIIYWVLVLYFSSGLPKGFQKLPSFSTETPNPLCL